MSMTEVKTIDGSVSMSQAIPDEYLKLQGGEIFAITAILLVDRTRKSQTFKTAKIHGLSLPDGKTFVKYRSSADAIVRKCEDLLQRACFADGSCKKAVRVQVVSNEGTNGPWLDLVDA